MHTIKTLAVLVVRFLVAMALSSVVLLAGVALDRVLPADIRLTLLVLPASIVLGFLPLLYWYRRDAYPIGLVFFTVTYVWLRYFATLSGLVE